MYILQFLVSTPGKEAYVVEEKEINLQNLGEAVELMRETILPPEATYARIITRIEKVVLVGLPFDGDKSNGIKRGNFQEQSVTARPRRRLELLRRSFSRNR